VGTRQQRQALRCAGREPVEEKRPALVAAAEALSHARDQEVQRRLRDGDLPGQQARPGRARVVAAERLGRGPNQLDQGGGVTVRAGGGRQPVEPGQLKPRRSARARGGDRPGGFRRDDLEVMSINHG
jgi:hypothetical protein